MRLHFERKGVEWITKSSSCSILVLVCTARFWSRQNHNKLGRVLVK